MKTFFIVIVMAMLTSLFSCCSDSRANSVQGALAVAPEAPYPVTAVLDEFAQLVRQYHVWGTQFPVSISALSEGAARPAVMQHLRAAINDNLKDPRTKLLTSDAANTHHTVLSPAQLRSSKMLLNTHKHVEFSPHLQTSDSLQYGLVKSDPDIGYIRLAGSNLKSSNQGAEESFEKRVELALQTLRNTKGLILDLRSSDGAGLDGLGYFAGRFLANTPALPIRKTIGSKGHHPFDDIRPTGEFQYLSPVVVLVDRKTRSFAEYIALTLLTQKHSYAMGNRTAGALADVERLKLKSDEELVLHMPVREVKVYSNGRYVSLEGKGIKPNQLLSPSVREVINGLDIHVSEATRYIQKRTGG